MKSHLTAGFIESFNRRPKRNQRSARRDYQLWRRDPNHPSLQFKRVGRKREGYSVRVALGWRALGVKDRDTMVWFWIGLHAEYEQIPKRL